MISLAIPIKAKPTPRPRGKAGQRAYYPKAYQSYRDTLVWQIRKAWADAGWPKLTPPYSVKMTFDIDEVRIIIRESDSHRNGMRGDIDNIYKGIADALEQVGIIDNDRQIHEVTLTFG